MIPICQFVRALKTLKRNVFNISSSMEVRGIAYEEKIHLKLPQFEDCRTFEHELLCTCKFAAATIRPDENL